MQTAITTHEMEAPEAVDTYLGFAIQSVSTWYMAVPMGWSGEILEAADLPQMRRKIWRWWHQPEAARSAR